MTQRKTITVKKRKKGKKKPEDRSILNEST